MAEQGERRVEKKIQTVDADLREGWDLLSWSAEFVTWAQKQKWYRPNLLYSGFDADDIGKRAASLWGHGRIFCASEAGFLTDERSENPLSYAEENPRPAIAVYDPEKMEEESPSLYRMKDETALLKIVKLVLT